MKTVCFWSIIVKYGCHLGIKLPDLTVKVVCGGKIATFGQEKWLKGVFGGKVTSFGGKVY